MIRKCSECPNDLPAGHKKTCSDACRQRRTRRLKRIRKEAGQHSPYRDTPLEGVHQVVTGKVRDVVHEVAKEEVRPIVREALTEDVVAGIAGLIKLVPDAVQTLQEQLAVDDPLVRQRATELVLRYTLGHKSVAPPPVDQQPSPMTVVFNVPRNAADLVPQDVTESPLPLPAETEDIPDADVMFDKETRECCECHLPKTDFVAGSERCTDCHAKVVAQVQARFGGTDE